MVIFRRYSMLSDFQKVYDLAVRCYNKNGANGICAPFWEYGQSFGSFDAEHSHRIGLWEDDGKLVAVATYEINLGEAYFILDPNYKELIPELIDYAEKELCDNNNEIDFCICSTMTEFSNALTQRNYEMIYSQDEKVYDFSNGLLNYSLPEGFHFFEGDIRTIDYVKFDKCLHYGFNHDDEPDGDTDFRIHMHTTPHFDGKLPVLVVDNATGEYAGYGGMFVVPQNKLAYLEPLCVHPDYRRKGLAAAIISELMRRVILLDTDHMSGGSIEFYTAIGFDAQFRDEIWRKKK